MILKALYDYYHRSDGLAPEGFEEKEIHFIIVLDDNGKVINVEDRRIDKKRCQSFLVVKDSRTSAPKPFIFYDNVEYVLGYIPPLDEKIVDGKEKEKHYKQEIKAKEKHFLFIDKCKALASKYVDCKIFHSITLFYETNGIESVMLLPIWEDITKKVGANISFMLYGDTEIAASKPELEGEICNSDLTQTLTLPRCLVTGEKALPIEITTPTSIQGSQAMAKLVSFQVNSGYDSYGKSQGSNAPISKSAEAAYTTALNSLLSKDSRNKFIIGNRTFLFWAFSQSEGAKAAEESMFSFFNFSSEYSDNPNLNIEKVKKAFNAIYSGQKTVNMDDKFYFLGLAPNAARIAVVYWNETKLKDFASQIVQHFDDMDIADTRNDGKPYYGLFQMLSSVCLKGKVSDVQPNLPEAVIKSILQNVPYPYTLFAAVIRRIRAEQSVTICRAAIIKAYLNRLKDNNHKKINKMLDKENVNQGYLCGRLFATLEYLQERSNGGNSTIRGRYMNAASSTPAAVFSTLLNLSVHHSEKLDKGSSIFFGQILGEIVNNIEAKGFPAHLDLNDQGRFMVGYYHQRQEFYSKKEKE